MQLVVTLKYKQTVFLALGAKYHEYTSVFSHANIFWYDTVTN